MIETSKILWQRLMMKKKKVLQERKTMMKVWEILILKEITTKMKSQRKNQRKEARKAKRRKYRMMMTLVKTLIDL